MAFIALSILISAVALAVAVVPVTAVLLADARPVDPFAPRG